MTGLQEIRVRLFVDEPDGNRMIAYANWQTYIDNATPRADIARQPYLRAKGRYTGADYCEASLCHSAVEAAQTGSASDSVAR